VFCVLWTQLLALRFSKDQRLNEVRRLLNSSQPVHIAIQQRPEVRLIALLLFSSCEIYSTSLSFIVCRVFCQSRAKSCVRISLFRSWISVLDVAGSITKGRHSYLFH